MNNKLVEEVSAWDNHYCEGELCVESREILWKILDRHAEVEEPKDCGFTLATCPYERCSGITKRADKVKEPWGFIKALCKRAFETSKSKGWKHDNDGQAIALMHSELSEALEAMRQPDRKDEHLPHLDPVGLELADVLIRVFDFCGARGIDLATCVKEKMAYNKNRPMKHGGKAF